MSRYIDLIVIHCSASPNDRTLFEGQYGTPTWRNPAQVIDRWHAERKFSRDPLWRRRQEPGLAAIGYHYVIARNGALFNGRHHDEVGAHAQGWNATSLGICLVGTDAFQPVQMAQLAATVKLLAARENIPLASPVVKINEARKGVVVKPGIIGHGKLPGHNKACPGFDVAAWLETLQ